MQLFERNKKVYISGPYANGDVALNVRQALFMADILAERGFAPFVPHLSHFWHMVSPKDYEFWLQLDLVFVPLCDYFFRLPGESKGADREEKLARARGIPVFYEIDSLQDYDDAGRAQ